MTTNGLTSEQITTIRDYLRVANDEQLSAIIPMVKSEINRRYEQRMSEVEE